MAKKSKHVAEAEAENDGNGTEEQEMISPSKIKKENDKPSYEELLNHVSVIAKPVSLTRFSVKRTARK